MTITNLAATLDSFDELQEAIDRNWKRYAFEFWWRLNDPETSTRAVSFVAEEKAAMVWASKFRSGVPK